MNIKIIMHALENGQKILIEADKNNTAIKNHEAATFFKRIDGYRTSSYTLGTLLRPDLNYKKIARHFLKMNAQGFIISII